MKQKIALLSVILASLLSACEPKPTPSDSESQAASEAMAEVKRVSLEGDTQPLDLQLPTCQANNCPEIDIARLSSNQAYVDQWVDAEILKVLQQILSIAPHPNSEPSKILPEHAASEAADQAQLTTAKTSLEHQLQPYVKSFLYLDQELKDLSANHQISVLVKPRILNDQGPLATVVLNSSSYLGGAHGSSSQQYANFDLTQGKQILLKDIVLPKQQAALEKAAYAVFKAWVMESKLAENMRDYEQAWKFHLSENFYLSEQGLVLQYAEYEIGPYVMGLPKLTLSYQDLDKILKPEYLPVAESAIKQP